jgi:hypothetical protein
VFDALHQRQVAAFKLGFVEHAGSVADGLVCGHWSTEVDGCARGDPQGETSSDKRHGPLAVPKEPDRCGDEGEQGEKVEHRDLS